MAAKEVLKWPFIDTSRVAVHGWSGGAAMTLNLLFRYPEIYKTGDRRGRRHGSAFL